MFPQIFALASLSGLLRQSNNCIDAYIDVGRSNISIEAQTSVIGCQFKRISSFSQDGGVIYITSTALSVIIDECVFISCMVGSSKRGGAIFVSYTKAQISLSRVCSSFCSADEGHFGYMLGSTLSINLLTMSKCSTEQKGLYCFHASSPQIVATQFNSSFNKAERVSGFGYYSITSVQSSFNTVFNNTEDGMCLWINGNPTISFSRFNIVNNRGPSSFGVFRVYSGTGDILNSVIINNYKIMFVVVSGSLNVVDSYVLHESTFSLGNCIQKSLIFSATETHALVHMDVNQCKGVPTTFMYKSLRPLFITLVYLITQ